MEEDIRLRAAARARVVGLSGGSSWITATHEWKLEDRVESDPWSCERTGLFPGTGPKYRTPAIRPHVGADHPAFGADRPPVQVQEHGVVRPVIGVDDRAVMAKAGTAVDQQVTDAMRANMAESDRRPSISLRPSFRRRIIVGIAVSHQTRFLDRIDFAD
jgi:hypothetical protein